MQSNTLRSVCLALLMIASVFVPLADLPSERSELSDERVAFEAPPVPCLGNDACRGTDSGNTYATAINLTGDFDWTGVDETNVYYGDHLGAPAYGYADDLSNDMFIIDPPAGYGVSAKLTWNHSTPGSYLYSESYAYYLYMGSEDMLGYTYTDTSTYGKSWAYCYRSDVGELQMSTENWEMYEGNYAGGTGYCYKPTSDYYSTFTDVPHDLAGEPMMVGVYCNQCFNNAYQDYALEITVFAGDAGAPGDTTQSSPVGIEPWDSGDTVVGNCMQYGGSYCVNSVDPSTGSGYWSVSGPHTMTLSSGESFGLFMNWDNYALYESAISMTCTNAASYSFGAFPTGDGSGYQGPTVTGPDSCSVTLTDSFGDGGIEAYWASLSDPLTGILTGTMFDLVDVGSGIVSSTDGSDMWGLTIPDGLVANISLSWEQSADLDLYVYTNSDGTGMTHYSWYDNPEFIDLGLAVTNTTVFLKVDYYPWGSSSSWAGYKLTIQFSPAVPPPCGTQDDGGSGDDAVDLSNDGPLDLTNLGNAGTITGMVCTGYDDEDWYEFTVPAYHGLWARLDWVDTQDSDVLYFYQYMDLGYQSQLSWSTLNYGFPQAVATNESWSYNNALSSESTVWLRVWGYSLPDDFEMNYTMEWSIYNQTEEPDASIYQNDAGLGIDAGDTSYYSTGSTPIVSMNNTLTGYGHDSWDMYDTYEIYIPSGYALMVELTFPIQNDLELFIMTPSTPGNTYLYTRCSSYNYNPETCSIQYQYGGDNAYIKVTTDRGSGEYTLDITMITPDNEPGANPDDCGTGVDASDNIYTNPGGNTWLNNSNQIDANGDANDTAGICTGWISDMWDERDYYNILVPAGKYLSMNVSWIPDGQWIYTNMYKCQVQTIPCSYPANGAYYVSQQSSNSGSTSGISGLWVTNGGWLTLGIYTYGAVDITYTMDLQFLSLADLVGGIQNDAGSGLDAGSGAGDALHADNWNNVTANNTLEFSGWNHPVVDTTDMYTFDVPANFGYEVCVEHDGTQYGTGGSYGTVLIILDLYGATSNPLPANTMVYFAVNPMCWSTDSSTGYFGDDVNMIGVRNWFASSYPGSVGIDYNVTISYFTLDADGDGWYDDMELSCGTDPYDNASVPQDTDADGICDTLDSDTDGDGVIDSEDAFPNDPDESTDHDGDGIGDNSDYDLDNDGWNNTDEADCLTDPLDAGSYPVDFDNDTICDLLDPDDDNDGYLDFDDEFPKDPTEWADNDGDLVGDNADMDDDNDGYDDILEIECLSNPLDLTSIPTDQDLDGICDAIDNDMDGDGVDNENDLFSTDPTEWADFDGDGIGDNADIDDDNDLVLDVDDAFPYDQTESVDTDGDGVGDNADLNDDGDAWTDAEEFACGSDSLDADSVPDDFDGDAVCDKVDTDDDGDGVLDENDAFPYDAGEWADLDGDGIGDNTDDDDDGDGWTENEEQNCGTDGADVFSVPSDNDRDGLCDVVDQDNDNDGVINTDDAFPMDPSETNDLDGDGTGDNTDQDDDGDGWLDVTESICAAAGGQGDSRNADVMPVDNETDVGADGVFGTDDDVIVGDGLCNAIDPDDDGDGYPDPVDINNILDEEDAFQYDPTEWDDHNADGSGDNGVELTILDDISAEPAKAAGVGIGVFIAALGLSRMFRGSEEDDEFDDEHDYTDEFDDEDLEEVVDDEDVDEN